MTLGEIIKEYREQHHLSQSAFARMSGLSKSYISLLELNRHPKTGKPIAPSIESIRLSASAMHMDFDDLFSKIDSGVVLNSNHPYTVKEDSDHPYIVKENSDHSYEVIKDSDNRSAPIIAPILGRIPAGYPLEAIEDRIGEEELSPLQYDRSKKYFCLTIHGDSMYPKYLEGDTVVFEWCPDCESGSDCAVSVNGYDATFKKVIKKQNCIVLQPLNPEYEPIIIDHDDPSSPVTIYGIAREIRRSV